MDKCQNCKKTTDEQELDFHNKDLDNVDGDVVCPKCGNPYY